MEDALPIIHILFTQRSIESVSVTSRLDVGRWSTFAEHGLDGISGDEVYQKKNTRHHQPDDREGVEEPD
jgi:hypothetical protein